MKRILIADDHPAIRNGVKQIIAQVLGEIEFGEASNAIEVFKLVKEQKWDIMILDIDMPGRNGLEVLSQLKTEQLKVPVLIFSMHPEDQVAVRVLKSGAAGYIQKDAPSSELIRAIQLLLSGRKYITSSLAEQLALQLENPLNKAPHELLSDREYETILLFAKGRTASQVAKELSLSVSTISTFRAHILEKMGMKTNAQLVTYAIRHHLV